MARKNSNLKIVEHQTEAELQAKYEREKAAKQRGEEEDSWRLTRQEITARARALRIELEAARARLEGMTFDVVTDDALDPHSMSNCEKSSVKALVDAFDPCIPGHFKRVKDALRGSEVDDDVEYLRWRTAETAFHIAILAGPIFAGASDREIDRLERGLIHATVSRGWRCKDRG
jgi:hypothetical protein